MKHSLFTESKAIEYEIKERLFKEKLNQQSKSADDLIQCTGRYPPGGGGGYPGKIYKRWCLGDKYIKFDYRKSINQSTSLISISRSAPTYFQASLSLLFGRFSIHYIVHTVHNSMHKGCIYYVYCAIAKYGIDRSRDYILKSRRIMNHSETLMNEIRT